MAPPRQLVATARAQLRENLLTWLVLYGILVVAAEAFALWVFVPDTENAGQAGYVILGIPIVAAIHLWYRLRRERGFTTLARGLEPRLVDAGVSRGSPVLFFDNGLWAEQIEVFVDPSDPASAVGTPMRGTHAVPVLVFRAAYDAGGSRIPISRTNRVQGSIPRAKSNVVAVIPGADADPGIEAALNELNVLMGVPAGTVFLREWKPEVAPEPLLPRWVCEYEVPFDERFIHPDAVTREIGDIANVLDQVHKVCAPSEFSPDARERAMFDSNRS